MRISPSLPLYLLLASRAFGGVVISEIHYHPANDEASLEWVEIANDASTPRDVSGYAFVDGISYIFPPGTILPGNGFLVIARDAEAVEAVYGVEALGNFGGRLDNDGERLTVVNHAGVVVETLRYRDRDKWPTAPDGTGHTLALLNAHLDSSEPESWAGSSELGGTPGAPNFDAQEVAVEERVIIDAGEIWRYSKGTQPFSIPADAWIAPLFDDTGWEVGPSGFGFREVGGAFIAYEVPAGTAGNQAFGGSLGMDFDVHRDIVIARLGVFDSGSDGLNLPITARLYNRSTGAELARLDFSPASPGELVGGSRFKDLPEPVSLSAGFRGTIAASGYGAGEENGNQGSVVLNLSTNDGQGSISFVGAARYGMSPDAFPDTVDGGPADRYAAGTFEFRPAGNPDGVPEAPPGVLSLLDDMPGNYTSFACRIRFTLTQEQIDEPGDFFLGIDYDDGFCAFVNGGEAARRNCGALAEPPAWDEVATGARAGGGEEFFSVARGLLVAGENVLAIAGYNVAIDNPDFLLIPRLLKRRILQPVGSAAEILFNELFRGARLGEGWVELYNPTSARVDISGFTLTNDADRLDALEFPDGTGIGPRGFRVVDEAPGPLDLSTPVVRLFLVNSDGLVATAAIFHRPPPLGLSPGEYSELRYPDGGALEWLTDTPSRALANQVPRIDDIVINEIMYHPPEDRDGEYIEFLNRGEELVDMSGFSIDSGVQYTFPDGTTLAPGEYVVVTESPDRLMEHHAVEALGPWVGQLSNRGEAVRLVDDWGNPVDKVRYHEGGRWSLWADGRGSSLELIDPYQDNSMGSAWDASDETDKAPWEEHTFHVPAYRPAAESELNIYLGERGTCLVDDVSVRRDGGSNHIVNSGFEASTASWLIGGTHVHSRRITAESRSGSACLQIIATGKGDTLVNRLETETNPAMTSGPYDVTLWARWQRGTSLMIVHGEYTPGPYRTHPCITCGVSAPNLSGNSMASAIRMTVPLNLGTPGAENSVRLRLRDETGSDNLGPVIGQVTHSPPLPEPGQPVPVTARVSDSDGVSSVEIFYRTGSAAGAFQTVSLLDDGLHGEGIAGDGSYGGQLPGFPQLTRVVFYVEAVDGAGARRRFPVDAPERTCLFLVQAPPVSTLDAYGLVLDSQRASEFQTRQLHSNDLLDGTFVFDNEEVYYNIGTRYRGSPWGRPSRASYRVRFPRDDVFHRGLRNINISRAGSNASEGSAHFFTERNASPGKPAPTADFLYIRTWFNGSALGNKAMIEPIDGSFSKRWYGEESDGPLVKAWGRFVFTDAGGLIGQRGWEGASLVYRGDISENYRGYYGHSMNETRDDWRPLFALTRMLESAETPNERFDREVGDIVDLDAFFQVLSTRVLLGDGDAFGVNNGHNGYLSFNSISGLWGILAFDLEASFRFSSPNLFASLDPGVSRLLARPGTRRAYLRVLVDFIDGYWSADTPAPFLDAIARETGLGTGGIRSFVSASAARTRSIVQPFLSNPFRIVTKGGADIESDESNIELEGEAPVNVATILYGRGDDDFQLLDPLWTTPTRWRFEFDLPEVTNDFEFLGFDSSGILVGSASIRVSSSLAPSFEISGWFPDSGPASGGTTVTFFGSSLADGMRVFFSGVESPLVTFRSEEVIEAATPPARPPLPADGRVDVEFDFSGRVLLLADAFTYAGSDEATFTRGDANADGMVDLSDAILILLFLFSGGSEPSCEMSADVDNNGDIDLTDPIFLLDYLFRRGARPLPPFEFCGTDPSEDGLECSSFTPCGH